VSEVERALKPGGADFLDVFLFAVALHGRHPD
jgi:hypothetical protein